LEITQRGDGFFNVTFGYDCGCLSGLLAIAAAQEKHACDNQKEDQNGNEPRTGAQKAHNPRWRRGGGLFGTGSSLPCVFPNHRIELQSHRRSRARRSGERMGGGAETGKIRSAAKL
jgi:hypothetical protein